MGVTRLPELVIKTSSALNNSFNDIENKIIEEKKIFDLNKDSILENNIEKKLNLLNDIKILIEKETDSVKGWQKKN